MTKVANDRRERREEREERGREREGEREREEGETFSAASNEACITHVLATRRRSEEGTPGRA